MKRPLFGAAAAALVSMVVVFMLKTYADALILGAYGVRYVPHFFVAQAVATIGLAAGYGQLMRGRTAVIDAGVILALGACCFAAPALVERGGVWPFALALAISSLAALVAMLAWNAATGIVSGRAARALIPKMGAAASIGAVLGGFGASAVVATLGTSALGPAAGALLMVLGALTLRLERKRASEAESRQSDTRRRRVTGDRSTRRLIIALAAAAVVESLLAAVIDLGFKRDVAAHVDADSLGLFFALFYAGANTALLVVQLVVAPRVLSAVSLRLSLAVEPLAIAGLAMAWTLAPVLLIGGLIRGSEMVGKFGIARPAQEIALSPLRDETRRRWKVLLRGVFAQGGAVAGGGLLVVLAPILIGRAWLIPAIAAVLAVVWLVLQQAVGGRYLDTLGSALGMLRLSKRDRAELELDRAGLGKVIELVASADPELAAIGRETLSGAVRDAAVLAPHLQHHDMRVRAVVYQMMAAAPCTRNLPALRRAAASELDAYTAEHGTVVAAALDALAAHGDPSAVKRARDHASRLEVRDAIATRDSAAVSAWSYLTTTGALDEDEGVLLDVMAAILEDDGSRAAALYRGALDRQRISTELVDDAIVSAITCDENDRRSNGLDAAAALGRSKPLVGLLKALDAGTPGAEESLAGLDDSGLSRLGMLVGARHPGTSLVTRMVRGLRANANQSAAELAARYLRSSERSVRDVAANTLARHLTEHGNQVDEELLEAALTEELENLAYYVAARWQKSGRGSSMVFRHDLSASADVFFEDELERRTEKAISQLCAVLALLANPAKVHAAERALLAPTLRNRRGGVDILQEVASGAQRTRLFALLESYIAPPSERQSDTLAAVCDHDPWLRRCASTEIRRIQAELWALRTTALFDRVDGEALVALAESAVEERHPNGAEIAREGQETAALWLILEGRLDLTRTGHGVRRLGVGQSFGQLALIDNQPSSVTATANGELRLLRLPRHAFQQARADHAEIGLGLVRGLAASLRRANAAAAQRGGGSPPGVSETTVG